MINKGEISFSLLYGPNILPPVYPYLNFSMLKENCFVVSAGEIARLGAG
jgi:hypothetical protein